ncbi:MAG TPA: hypothetical protein VFC63_02955 [Blastocatellia bacterium]|nr:hypothetical protein [Blastocatellia bacterium]
MKKSLSVRFTKLVVLRSICVLLVLTSISVLCWTRYPQSVLALQGTNAGQRSGRRQDSRPSKQKFALSPRVIGGGLAMSSPPSTSSVSPSSATVGSAGFSLTVNGSNFVNGDIVQWNGSSRTTAFVNSSQLTATIPASDLLLVGSFNVTVLDPSSTLTSNAQTFSVTATATVTNLNDTGAGSLRTVIGSVSTGGTIGFSVAGTITLTSGIINITKNMTIVGPGAGIITVSGNNASGVFAVTAAAGNPVTISGMTITQGKATNGGGLSNATTNTVAINDCVFSNNTATGNGGAINNTTGGTMNINRTLFTGNSGFGGAVFNSNGSATTTTLNMTNCTVSGNTGNNATGSAGGIVNQISSATGTATATITNCTIANNAVSGTTTAGGIIDRRTTGTGSTVNIKNTIISGNTSPNTLTNGTGTSFTSGGGNVIGDNPTGFTGTNDKKSTDPLILNRGGLTGV